MSRARIASGVVVGVFLLLSSVAHSGIGWSVVKPLLDGVDGEVVSGVGLSWRLGGASMIGFGLIVLYTFGQRLRGGDASLVPARIIALTYATYGLWAFATSGWDPFFAGAFLAPGVVLGYASLGDRAG